MKLALWATGPYANDGMFDPSSPVNRDDGASAYRELQIALTATGGAFHTLDVYESRGDAPDVVLFLEIPARPVATVLSRHSAARAWVVLYESEVVLPRNWLRSRHGEFERLFTWNDDVVDDETYFKLNFPNPLHDRGDKRAGDGARDFVMIAGNKSSPHPLELYSERLATIRWFEQNAPDRFDLYGGGWQASYGAGPIRRRVDTLAGRLRAGSHFPSWRGRVEVKTEMMRQYRFGFCYENARGIPGYVTEKLFDCLASGCIPIYWGPPNASELIDPACYIDRSSFADTGELVRYVDSLSESDLDGFRAAGAQYLQSGADPYSNDFFVRTLMTHLKEPQP